MEHKYFIGLDPSFSAFGIVIIDTDKKLIILDQMKSDNHHDFRFMCWSIVNMCNKFVDRYKWYINSLDTHIAQEAPISSGINSGKLNALGMHFYVTLGSYSDFNRIRTYHPIKLKVFHHKKKYSKQDTIEVINKIIEYLETEGYSVKVVVSRTKKSLTITDGEADAFMYAIKALIDYRRNDKIVKHILEMYPRFEMMQSIEEKVENE